MKSTRVKKMIVSIMLIAFLFTTSMNTYTIKSAGLDDSVKTQLLAQRDSGFKTDRFIIKYKNEEDAAKVGKAIKSSIYKTKKIKGKKNNLSSITLKEKKSAQGLISELKQKSMDTCIEYIQPDYKLTLSSNDPYFSSQWGLGSTVSGVVYSGSAYIESAWEESQGEGVTVGVIDTAIDINHEDLKENIWVNTGEIPGNGIDDDGNGYVDDVTGWNFSEDNNVVNTGDMDHGTHIAGIIAAVKDNGKGIAGVAPKAKVMPLKVFSNGQAYTSDIVEAIEYAEKMGVKVINGSWGSNDDNQALKEAIEGSSMLFVCAAGNSGINIDESPVYPASYASDNVIAVASVDRNGNLASDSNYGANTVDVAAPGVKIIGTLPGNIYSEKSGTSMAAGFVSGEAALVLEKYKDYSAKDVKDKIADTSFKVNGLKIIDAADTVTNDIQAPIGVDTSEEEQQTVVQSVSGYVYDNKQLSVLIKSVKESVYTATNQPLTLFSTASTYETSYGFTSNLIKLPSSSVSGRLNLNVKGNTVVNLLGNKGDFEDLSSWLSWGGGMTQNQTLKVIGSSAMFLSSDTGTHVLAYTPIKLDTSKCYLFSGYALSAHDMIFTIGTMAASGAGGSYSEIFHSTDTFSRKGFKFKPTNEDLYLTCYLYPRQGEQAQGVFDGLMINEISNDDFDSMSVNDLLIKYPYVNSVKSIIGNGIRSIGKNLFDNRVFKALADCSVNKGEVNFINNKLVFSSIGSDAYTLNYDFVNLAENRRIYALRIPNVSTMYLKRTIEGLTSGTTNEVVFYYDESYNFISLQNINCSNGEQVSTLIIPPNARYIVPRIGTSTSGQTVCFSKYMLSTENTSFEEYEESEAYYSPEVEVRKLLDGISDEIDNEGLFIKATNKVLLDDTLSWVGFNNSQFNTIIHASILNWGSTNNALCDANNMVCGNNDISFESIFSFVDNGRAQVAISADKRLWVAIPKDKIGGNTGYTNDLNGFVKYLTDKKTELIYQLDKPQIYKVNTTPLICYENGAIITEPVVKRTSTYMASGIMILNKNLPVKFIETVYKLDGSLMSPVDMSKVHIASNGLSFTIDGAKPGEDYEYVYQYDQSLTTLPTIKYSVPTNQAAQIEGNTDMIELLTKKIELLEERLKAIESDRAVQYEYDSNGRLIRRLKN